MSGGVTFKKVPIDSPGEMATVEEVIANQDMVMSLLEEWTIALLNGGKVVGKGHGGTVSDGDYKQECGEKIIVERSEIKEKEATVVVKEQSMTQAASGYPDSTQYYQHPTVEDLNDSVTFVYHGDEGSKWEDKMGTYIKTSEERQGYPVFKGEKYFLFVGPLASWILAPSCDSDEDLVLKHPKNNPAPALPPRTGWIHKAGESSYAYPWEEEESIEAIVKIIVCYLVSSGGAPSGASSGKYNSKLGAYAFTGHTIDNFPVFKKDKDYLFVSPSSGLWTIGESPFEDIGYFRHLGRATDTPPLTGWQYRMEDSSQWQENAAITVDCKGTSCTGKQKGLPRLPTCIIDLEHHDKANITAVAISEEGRFVYTAGKLMTNTYDPYVFIWDVNQHPSTTSRYSRGYSTPSLKINLVAGKRNSQDDKVRCMKLQGNRLVVGGRFNCSRPIQVIDLGGQNPTFTSQVGPFNKSSQTCYGLALSPDGKMCYNIYELDKGNHDIDIWDIHNEIRVGQLQGHPGDISSLDISHDGKYLWSGGYEENIVRVWDLRTNKQLKQYEIEASFVVGLACSPIDNSAVATYSDTEICVLNSGKEDVEKYEVGSIGKMNFASSGKWFMIALDKQEGFSTPSAAKPSCSKLFTLAKEDDGCMDAVAWEISKDDKYLATTSKLDSYEDAQMVEVYKINY